MAKKRQPSTKKGKSISGAQPKSHKGKRGGVKRGAKHPKSKGSKRSTSTSSSSSKKRGQRKAQKAPSKFNLYMKTTVQKIKQDYPGITQKDAFKKSAEQWAVSPENPKNMHL